jgi:transcriptional regulator with GAF, ATPase, and Fis domain
VYVPVRAISVSKVALTIVWFACQLSILAVALTSFWYRPSDRVARNFCLMSCAAMGAFVPGFHWWVVSVNPLLNIPFILCAGLLPAFVLNFFVVFPREPLVLRDWSVSWPWLVFGPLATLSLLLVLTYWSGWALNSFDAPEILNVFQKLAAVTQAAMSGSLDSITPAGRVTLILAKLGQLIRLTIVVASGYFIATVVRLGTSLIRIQTPRERRQVLTILGAALLATMPIGYTLYLAFFRQVDFALGRAQLPMFVASMLFMAAYSHGMLRDRLMLAEDEADRGRRYVLISLLVSGGFALLLATGGVISRSYSLPLNSTTTQQISLFLILLLAAGLTLWVRDRVQAVVDRRFFSEKYQLDRAMQQLNRSAAYLAEPSGMAEITLKTCQDVLDAAWSMMFVRDGQGVFRLIGARSAASAPGQLRPELLADIRLAETVAVRIPSVSREEMPPEQRLLHELRGELLCLLTGDDGLHGVIVLGRRRTGAAFSAEDIAFLQAMAQMSVLALHSSRANQTMARLDAELKTKMDRIAEQQRQMAMLRAELTALQQEAGQAPANTADGEFDREGIRGTSAVLLDVLSQVRKVARSTATVLIRGESGTGKELLARVIHRNSDRAASSLVCVNCAALAPSLLESELFGHVKGAFTGAMADKPGRFQVADGGTLFLDEIGEISPEVQIKLLRVLQERTVEPVGSNQSIAVDVRLIAATNRNLQELIANGQFREDLFYRLNVVSVTLPPLRERPEDLAELVFCFLSRYAQRMKKQIRQIQPEALAVLEAHRWPGNIRELENVIERAVVLAESDVIGLDDLPEEMRRAVQLEKRAPGTGRSAATVIPSLTTVRAVARRGPGDPAGETPTALSAADEEAQLRAALKAADGNKAVAARSLNLPRSTFFSRCRKYGIP